MNPAAKRKAVPSKDTPEELLGDGRPVSTGVVLLPQQDEQGEDQPTPSTISHLPAQQHDVPRYTWSTRLTGSPNAGPNARLRVRTRLTVAHWSGNIDAAARVADKLVDNAVRHADPFGPGKGFVELRLTVLPAEELLIEVDDALPLFPDFEAVATQSCEPAGVPKGLWWVRHYRGALSWAPKKDDVTGDVIGKTVQAVLPTAWAASS
ncbi:hypothetical protein [Streptomyces sp. Tue6028]|uniref:hypothetical protein n=1 Tax=Streptomyces sp. Tue6028 TaxID=2036037 RepID=UPI003D74C6EC